ncbi:MAG: hypothetical protein FJX77_14350 [Armatimonadetes bacterium]|nr:hypothetical protein [Armatimonadota bacterium]
MKPRSRDTHPEIERMVIEHCRRMTGAERLANVRAMNQAGQKLQLANIRRQHPNATPWEIKMRLASRSLCPELMRRAFGWDPEKEGY